jgi:hypothetical protein
VDRLVALVLDREADFALGRNRDVAKFVFLDREHGVSPIGGSGRLGRDNDRSDRKDSG